LVQLETEGKSNYTKRNIEKFLQLINRKADLDNPKEVLLFISRHECSNSMKECLCYAYRRYCKYYNIEAKIPFHEPDPKPIHVPTKERLNIIISSASGAMVTKLSVSMETGVRPIELHTLKVKDVDIEQKLLYPTTAKHGASRTLKISSKLATMIQEHIIRHNLQPNNQLFKGTATQYGKNFRQLRNRLAEKLHDPTIRTIRLYDFRHYFCTRKCYEIQNPFIVMNLMGHKRLETTQIYMHLLNLEEGEWVCEGAETKDRAMNLIEAGFQYVTTIEGIQLFKKRK
jgi:integrase